MNLRRLFVLIPKINQVLFFLVLLGGIVGVLVGWFTSRGPDGVKVPEAGAAATAEPVAARLSFADPEAVRGSAVLMLRLSSLRGGAAGRLSSSEGYSGGGGDLRNVLFLLGNEAQPRWLFKNHQNLLRHVEQISGDPDDPEEGDTAAIYLEYASADTNGDQRLTHADRFSVALAHPDGAGLQVLLADVDRVFKHTVLEDDQFVVIYQKAEVLRQARFNLKTGKLLADQELVKVPQAL